MENAPGGPARTLQGELLFPVARQLDAWHHEHAMWFPKNASKTARCFCRAWKAACRMKQLSCAREIARLGLKTFFIHGLFPLRHVPAHVAEDTLWLSPDAARPPMLCESKLKSLLILAPLKPGFQTHLVPQGLMHRKTKLCIIRSPLPFLENLPIEHLLEYTLCFWLKTSCIW